MNKQSYHEYLFKHLRRNSKRILSIMLAFAILTENPLSAYASTKATPSNIPESSASIESTDTNIDIDTDFGVEDFETNPDQDPDHGPGIDSTTPTYPYYRPVVDTSTIPDEIEMDNDNLDAILGAGANCIDDFDPDNLEPLTPEQIEAAFNPESAPYDPNLENIISSHSLESEPDAQALIEVTALVGATLAVLWACGFAALKVSNGEAFSNQMVSYSNSFTPVLYKYYVSTKLKEFQLTAESFANTVKKLTNSKTANGYSITLTEEDKAVFSYVGNALSSNSPYYDQFAFNSLDVKHVNIKAIDGFKYYYFYDGDNYRSTGMRQSTSVLYTPEKAALALLSGKTLTFYYHNAATADYGFTTMKVHKSSYSLSSTTGMLEYKSGTTADTVGVSSGNASYTINEYISNLPFPVANSSSGDTVKQYIAKKDIALLLDYTRPIRNGSALLLDSLSTVTLTGNVYDTIKSEKNSLAVVAGVNQSAGVITGTTTKPGTDTGTETKPGTNTGSGGTGSTTDTSGALTSIIGIITSILTAASGIPNILSLFQALPNTIKESITDAISSAPFFREALVYLSSIASGVGDILDWDIDVWIDNAASTVTDAIDDWGARWMEGLANLPNVDNLADIIERALTATALSPILDIRDAIKLWNADNYAEAVAKALEAALGTIGLSSLPDTVRALKDLTDAKLGDVLEKLKELTGALTGLNVGIDLDALSDALKEILTALGLGSLLGALTDIGSMLKTFSLTDIINLVKALPASIVAAITEALPNWKTPEIEENANDSGFHNFLNLFMIGLLIIILLMILFINCLRFIVLVFNVPASSALIHADMLKGIEYMKNLQIPVFGVSLYALLLSCAYFVIFMTVIAAIRRKIDKMHI